MDSLMSHLNRSGEDPAAALRAIEDSHPTLSYIPPLTEGGQLTATWMTDLGPATVKRDTAGELATAVRARLRVAPDRGLDR